jgi:hypothetical protein
MGQMSGSGGESCFVYVEYVLSPTAAGHLALGAWPARRAKKIAYKII